MDYRQAITDICKCQRKMMPTLETLDREGKLPHGLRAAKDEALRWEDIIDGDAGLEEAPKLEPVERFARELTENAGLFNDSMKRDIEEYAALAANLKKVWNDPLGQ